MTTEHPIVRLFPSERVEENKANINVVTYSLSYYIFLRRHKLIFTFTIIYQHSDGPSMLSVIGRCSFIYTSNCMLPDVLATQEADLSGAMVLVLF